MSLSEFLSLDMPPLLTAAFASVACALLGNFLVLRKLSLMGDAISHAVLPGIVIAFLLSESRGALPIFIGAAGAGVLAAVLIEIVRKFGRLESGASMGVVFSILFALGILLIEQADARSLDLDADCLLHGQLESIFWYPPKVLNFAALGLLPSELWTSFTVMIVTSIFIVVLLKELSITAFDPALATSIGIPAQGLHYVFMVFVAAAVVASFEVVGSILVIAMLICPAASARLWTDRLKTQIILSAIFALLGSVLGYFLAAFGPMWIGFDNSVNAAGMMSVFSGFLLFLSVVGAPKYGIVARQLQQRRLAIEVCQEDLLGFLYRLEELSNKAEPKNVSKTEVIAAIGGHKYSAIAFSRALKKDLLTEHSGIVTVTEAGRILAKKLVRTHRLWETYLVNKLGLKSDHVHDSAMQLEHFTSQDLQDQLAEGQQHPEKDPHGKPIPE